MYKVVAEFYDLQDNFKHYLPGDTFPHDGIAVSESRLEYLASNRNNCGHPVIERVEQPEQSEEPKPKKRVRKNAD